MREHFDFSKGLNHSTDTDPDLVKMIRIRIKIIGSATLLHMDWNKEARLDDCSTS